MSDDTELKAAVEELSEKELDNLEILNKIADLVESTDTETINELPLLYRLEIVKALEKLDKDVEASKIRT
ncbi:MAG: hypothetical protein MUP66_02120 [Candidatus Nanohaloarchaeota archaeon QJJ-5]|nr:hypothetical protein [Candidatus Nanohaloarchaeota archaeon QJJ-5]